MGDVVNYATSEELRATADLIDSLNEVARSLGPNGSPITFDNVQVTDANGVPLGVLTWRTEADSFGIGLR